MADVAMTRRGFGEMAITGCMAGPVFNVLVGLGVSVTKTILTEKGLSAFNGEYGVSFSLYETD
jgi:Ca2+/Na+ antiporter